MKRLADNEFKMAENDNLCGVNDINFPEFSTGLSLSRLVHEATVKEKLPCPHSSCCDKVDDFYQQDGIAHHFRIAHKCEFKDSDRREAFEIRKQLHVNETRQYLDEYFRYRRENDVQSYRNVTVICGTSRLFCAVANERESVQMMCLLLFYGGQLQPYSKGDQPCDIETVSDGLRAKFHCWFIQKQDLSVSFQMEAFFVQRDFICNELRNIAPLHESLGAMTVSSSTAGVDVPSSGDKVLDALRDVFHHDNFRAKQRDIIDCLLDEKDCLAIIPTGGGKTICYCIPGLLSKGITVVITPLLALVNDQVARLRKHGLSVCFVNSKMTQEERDNVFHELTQKETLYKCFYLTPEFALSSQGRTAFQSMKENGTLGMFVIDEAHCIDMWGQNFRPSYGQLIELKQFNRPIAAFTATATVRTQDIIVEKLGMVSPNVFRLSSNRQNLYYKVIEKNEQHSKEDVVELVQKNVIGQCGIVYCFATSDTTQLAYLFKCKGIGAAYYHGQLDVFEQEKNAKAWLTGHANIMCATSAFGMGIDKPNVRFVIHHTLPKSLEEYYQEGGRAGRDGNKSTCILMYRFEDRSKLLRHIASAESDEYQSFMKQGLNKMASYCLSGKCRRTTILTHFNDELVECHGSCDNCQKQLAPPKDYTSDAISLCSCVEEMQTLEPKINVRQIALTFKGSKSKRDVQSKGFHNTAHYGAGAKLFRKDTDAIKFIHHLIIDNVLCENLRAVNDKSITPYITLGEKAQMLINGEINIIINF